MKKLLVTLCFVVCFSNYSNAVSTQYVLGVDDYVKLYIDGDLKASYDAYPAGGATTALLDLSVGWHDIEIDFKNRWGSCHLYFYEIDGAVYTIVPLNDLRSLDGNGNYISGLTATYYDLSGNYIKTVYGEGPISHGYVAASGGGWQTIYEGEPGLWADTYTLWGTFQEKLTGQIYVSGPAIPAPSAIVLSYIGLGLIRRIKR